ncbi:hypothetical protein IWZ00DRAFT_510387 [Phyllosticta capitalensis]
MTIWCSAPPRQPIKGHKMCLLCFLVLWLLTPIKTLTELPFLIVGQVPDPIQRTTPRRNRNPTIPNIGLIVTDLEIRAFLVGFVTLSLHDSSDVFAHIIAPERVATQRGIRTSAWQCNAKDLAYHSLTPIEST